MDLAGFPKNVNLPDGTQVVIRPMEAGDGKQLLEFFRALPEEDRQFLKEDVTSAEVVERFTKTLDYSAVLPLLALSEGKIAGDATLHRTRRGWSSHVGEIRAVVSRSFQRRGLGAVLVKEIVHQAVSAGLDKMVAEVVDNQPGARRAFEKLGFRQEAVLKGHVKDLQGKRRDLVILSNDVSHLWEAMEDLIAGSLPAPE